MQKDFTRVKLPRIEPSIHKASGVGSSKETKFFDVDSDTKDRNHSAATSAHKKSFHWKSAQLYLIANKRGADRNFNSFGRRMGALESSLKPNGTSYDQSFHSENTFTLPIRRNGNPEPDLPENNNPFTVRATSLKLDSGRTKDRTDTENKILTGVLPSVFLDTRVKVDNNKDKNQKDVRREIDGENTKRRRLVSKHRKTLVKESSDSSLASKAEAKDTNKYHRQQVNASVIDQNTDKNLRKPLKVLPKRRLSEQIDSYEINRSNENSFSRRITIRTSKSCPTIVIHECGESCETTDDAHLADNGVDSKEKQLNGCESLNKDTTSFVSCWRPNESIVDRK